MTYCNIWFSRNWFRGKAGEVTLKERCRRDWNIVRYVLRQLECWWNIGQVYRCTVVCSVASTQSMQILSSLEEEWSVLPWHVHLVSGRFVTLSFR